MGGTPSGEIIDSIYEASVLPEFWPAVLRDFAALAESREAVLVATNGESFRWVGSTPFAENLAQEVYTYPAAFERSRRLMALERAGFATERDVLSEAEILGEPMYAEFLIPRGYGRGIATAIPIPDGDTIIVHAEGDYSRGPVLPELIARLDGLRPHLARSAVISSRLSFERARTAVETLSSLGLAACAVTARGTVLLANAGFEAAKATWTTRGHDRVALADRRADRLLYEALGALHAMGAPLSLPMVRPDGGAAVLHVVPVRRAAHDLFANAAAILVLMQSSEQPTQATPLLQALFDLTPAEAHIAAQIAAGRTLGQIARTQGKSLETARGQLKRVLGKTGAGRQAELARLLAQLVPRQH